MTRTSCECWIHCDARFVFKCADVHQSRRNLIMSFPLLSKCSVLVHSSTHTEIEEEWKRRTQAEMVTTGRGHQHSLAWSDEVGIAVLMSVEWIWEESGTDEERVTKLGELARQLPFF